MYLKEINHYLKQLSRERVGVGKMGKGSQNVQTSSYEINKSWKYNF